jgi:hypothetical protein
MRRAAPVSPAPSARPLLEWSPRDHPSDRQKIVANSCPLSDASMTKRPRKKPAGILALGPSCVSATPQLKREGSLVATIVWIWESERPFKGIFCDDISEFESHMPSHAVGSL